MTPRGLVAPRPPVVPRLPVAPPPFREETLSSWLGRVACRYGLDAPAVAAALDPSRSGLPIDDVAPDPVALRIWARACGIDPGRLRRLSVKDRYPGRTRDDFMRSRRRQPICPACFAADHAQGRDTFLRAWWLLGEACACPIHRRMLIDRCAACHAPITIGFRPRDGRARAICAACRRELRSEGEGADDVLAPLLIGLQHAIRTVVTSDAGQREILAQVIATLWAPLDEAGAARPVLAIWLGEPNWHCPIEAAPAIGAPAPLSRLSVRWRAVTLIAIGELFGADLASLRQPSAAADRLLARAAPRPPPQRRRARHLTSPIELRPPGAYFDLATGILSSADWRASTGQPEPRRRRLLGRLMEDALRPSGGLSADRVRTESAEKLRKPTA